MTIRSGATNDNAGETAGNIMTSEDLSDIIESIKSPKRMYAHNFRDSLADGHVPTAAPPTGCTCAFKPSKKSLKPTKFNLKRCRHLGVR